ncbi:MAG: hypothetical protein HS116_26955 [Planctomycetes bacterium]|nr:hypothetical protein [Planctomycetota bacterium]
MLVSRGTLCALVLCAATGASAQQAERWDKDVGKEAPALIASAWIGTPVSLEAVKGNCVVLAFWNADVAC